jgi:hypothetical protein
MELGAIFVGLSMFVASMPFVIRPFQEHRYKKDIKSNTSTNPGEKRKDILSAIRDLDFDFSTGKVTEDDYSTLRAQLVAEAALHIQPEKSVEDDQLEAMISARKTSLSKGLDCSHCGKKITAGSRYCSQCGTAMAKTCPSCSKQVQDGDQFCTTCGAKLELKVEAVA